MNCEKVRSRLSEFCDEALENDVAIQLSKHLEGCSGCMREFTRLTVLRRKLAGLGKTQAPDFLYDLLQVRISAEKQEAWTFRLRSTLEYRWSRIRTTERIWFATRALGTVMTAVLFLAISYATSPFYIAVSASTPEPRSLVQAYREQLGISVLRNLGLIPVEAQRRPIVASEPRINDLYLLYFGQSVPREGGDDTFSVVTFVDRSGAAKIQGVLEYPVNESLLSDFNTMISSARCRPASQNGRAVDAHLVMTFSRVSVYN
jgi:hypothetical protein